MKRGWKIFWIICMSVLGVGIVLCIVGTAMGATLSEVSSAYETEEYYRDGISRYRNNWEDHTKKVPAQRSEEDVHNFQGIRKIDLELSYMRVVVKKGSSDSVIVDTNDVHEKLKDRLILKQEGSELKIEDQMTYRLRKIIGSTDSGTLVIQVPEDRSLEDVSLEVGAGQLEIENIDAGKLDIDVAAGEAVVKQFDVKELKVDCGAGQAELTGNVTHKSKIDCGVGSVKLSLTGTQDDYDYELDCGIGELKVGNDSYTGLSGKRRIDNGTGKKMEIDCGIGEINVSFGASR